MGVAPRSDRTNSLRQLGEQLAASGKTLDKKDLDSLLGAAKDLSATSTAELQKFFDANKDRFAADAREAFAKVIAGYALPVSNAQAMDGAIIARESRRAARGTPSTGPSAAALAAVAA